MECHDHDHVRAWYDHGIPCPANLIGLEESLDLGIDASQYKKSLVKPSW